MTSEFRDEPWVPIAKPTWEPTRGLIRLRRRATSGGTIERTMYGIAYVIIPTEFESLQAVTRIVILKIAGIGIEFNEAIRTGYPEVALSVIRDAFDIVIR